VFEVDEATGQQRSMDDTGFGGSMYCEPMAIASGHLVVTDGYGVTVY
jgi:hypothetical protein